MRDKYWLNGKIYLLTWTKLFCIYLKDSHARFLKSMSFFSHISPVNDCTYRKCWDIFNILSLLSCNYPVNIILIHIQLTLQFDAPLFDKLSFFKQIWVSEKEFRALIWFLEFWTTQPSMDINGWGDTSSRHKYTHRWNQ